MSMLSQKQSKQSVKIEAECKSANNRRSFKESKTAISLNPCDGNCDQKKTAMANVRASLKPNKDKDKLTEKSGNRVSVAGKKRHEKTRKGRYQVHLKKEDGDLNETIEYNVEFPNRVAVRMEYLMTSTKVRLNDRKFMDSLYDKLVAEEAKSLDKTTQLRRLAEKNRVKKLVIEGLMPPPNDMLELYHHPVFRVNTMLRRLDQHDKGLYRGPKIDSNITPVEPFEFDGNAFFKHLHEHGTCWVPSEERIDEEEKLAGKIARAKLRLMEKRRKEADNAKMLRLLYTLDHAAYEESDNNEDEDEQEDTPEITEEKRKRRILKLKDRLNEDSEKRAALFKKRQLTLERKERRRRERALGRQKERDKVFLDEREQERLRIMETHRLRMANKTLTNLGTLLSEENVPQEMISREPLMDYKAIFEQPASPPTLAGEEDESFTQIRKVFHVKGGNMLNKFRPNDNSTVARYMDAIKNADELFHFGNELCDMYSREQSKAEDFLIKLNRLI